MKNMKASLILLSAFLLSQGTASAVEYTIQRNIVWPLAEFTPSLHQALPSDPYSLADRWQKEADARGIFKPLGLGSVGVMTTMDSSGTSEARELGTFIQPTHILFYTNPASGKISQAATVNNKVGIYFSWHHTNHCYQIHFSGTITPKNEKPSSINISLPGAGRYESGWQAYEFIADKAKVAKLTHHYDKDGQVYCVIERATYLKRPGGTWTIKKEEPYVAKNAHRIDDVLPKK